MMLLKRQRHQVTELARELQVKSAVRRHTKRVLKVQQRHFFANPVNLLLPFTAGALASFLAGRRKPTAVKTVTVKRESSAVEWMKTGTALWAMATPLRERLKEQGQQKQEKLDRASASPPVDPPA